LTPFGLPSALLDAGAVRLSPRAPFTWASGLKSPIYCDNRQLLGFPSVRNEIRNALAAWTREHEPTLVAGASTGGIPWAALVADLLGLPMVYVRPEPKRHGMGRQVEGPHADGHRVVLIEDLISTGGSSVRCVEALRHEDATVLEVLGLFSYDLPQAREAFEAAGLPHRVLATFQDLLEAARDKGTLDASDLASLGEWREDTVGWSRRHE
jgi:orotate phosphoribosyltransferase